MTRFFLATLGLFAAVAVGMAAEKDTRTFELRVYSAEKGKQATLNIARDYLDDLRVPVKSA